MRNRRVAELLDWVGMPGMGPAMPRELSGGETQRVAFARAVAHVPPILLADEPTASLDSEAGGRLIGLIQRAVGENGCTLIVATHDPDIVAASAGPIGLIHFERSAHDAVSVGRTCAKRIPPFIFAVDA